jgi:hypothetical protein
MVVAFFELGNIGSDTLLIYALYTVLNKHPSSALLNGKRASISRVLALVLLVIMALLGAALVGLASATSVTLIKAGDTFGWAESVFNALSRGTAAFYILYFILSVELMILAWTASVVQPKPRSKVSSLLSSPSKIQARES